MAEKENFCRFSGILQDIGAKVLREVFLDKYVGTRTLAGYFAVHKKDLTGLLPNTLRIEQFDLLYPLGGGAPVIEDFDITLLCLLFRNLDTQTTPYDSVWTDPQTNQTYQADVTRIRLIRNTLFGHVSSCLMSNMTYINEMSNLTTIYYRLVKSLSAGRMSSTELQEMIDQELNLPSLIGLDTEVKRLKEEMQERYKHGIFNLKGVCDIDRRVQVVYCSDYFLTVSTTAHELGHSLGAVHDGEPDAVDCKAEDMLSMSSHAPIFQPTENYSRNPWLFSNCSVEQFKKTLRDKFRFIRVACATSCSGETQFYTSTVLSLAAVVLL